MSNIKINSRWVFKNTDKKLVVKVFELNKQEVVYGIPRAVSGHISTTRSGFLKNYELEKKWLELKSRKKK